MIAKPLTVADLVARLLQLPQHLEVAADEVDIVDLEVANLDRGYDGDFRDFCNLLTADVRPQAVDPRKDLLVPIEWPAVGPDPMQQFLWTAWKIAPSGAKERVGEGVMDKGLTSGRGLTIKAFSVDQGDRFEIEFSFGQPGGTAIGDVIMKGKP